MKNSILFCLSILFSSLAFAQWTQLGTGLDVNSLEDGHSVSMDASGTIVAGANRFTNEVMVFQLNNGVWSQRGETITKSSMDIDEFGESLKMNSDGSIIAVGDHLAGTGDNESGTIFVYEWNGSNYIPKGSRLDGVAAEDELSKSVIGMSSDGLTIVAGARHHNAVGSNSGHVLVFQWDNDLGDWVQKGNPMNGTATNEAAGEFVSMSADGNTVSYSDLTSDAGFVYIYEWNATSEDWEQKGSTIVGDPGDVWTGASTSLSADGNTIAYGAPRYETYTGLVKVYEFNGTDWVQKGQTYFGEFEESWFGRNLELSADASHLVVNAWSYDLNADGEEALNTGMTVVLEYNGTSWEQKGELLYGTDVGARMGEKGVRISSDNSTIAFLDEIDGFNSPRVYTFLEPIGINKAEEDLVQVYPNPVSDLFFIELNENAELFLRTLDGKLILKRSLFAGKNKLEVAQLPAGIYQVQVVGVTQNFIQTLVKE
ncbi:MAG: T9SS type A sorting domain-containing protein [Flavobacteriales bacterium]